MGLDFDAGSGGREAEVSSLTVLRGSPLVCSIVVAIPRRKARGARRRVARRRAMMLCGLLLQWRNEVEIESRGVMIPRGAKADFRFF